MALLRGKFARKYLPSSIIVENVEAWTLTESPQFRLSMVAENRPSIPSMPSIPNIHHNLLQEDVTMLRHSSHPTEVPWIISTLAPLLATIEVHFFTSEGRSHSRAAETRKRTPERTHGMSMQILTMLVLVIALHLE